MVKIIITVLLLTRLSAHAMEKLAEGEAKSAYLACASGRDDALLSEIEQEKGATKRGLIVKTAKDWHRVRENHHGFKNFLSQKTSLTKDSLTVTLIAMLCHIARGLQKEMKRIVLCATENFELFQEGRPEQVESHGDEDEVVKAAKRWREAKIAHQQILQSPPDLLSFEQRFDRLYSGVKILLQEVEARDNLVNTIKQLKEL